MPEQVLASEVLLLRGPSGVHQTLFFQTIREHSHHISKLFPTCIRKSNFLTCEWGVSTGLIHMVPEKSTPTLIFQVTVMHHMQKKNNFPPFFSSPKSLLHQVGAEGQQLEERGSGGNREICNLAKVSANLCQRPPILLPRPPPKSRERGGAGPERWRRCSEPTTSTDFITNVYIVLSCFLFCITIGNPERSQAAVERSSQPCREA